MVAFTEVVKKSIDLITPAPPAAATIAVTIAAGGKATQTATTASIISIVTPASKALALAVVAMNLFF